MKFSPFVMKKLTIRMTDMGVLQNHMNEKEKSFQKQACSSLTVKSRLCSFYCGMKGAL